MRPRAPSRPARGARACARAASVSATLLIASVVDAEPCAVRAELAGDAGLIREVGVELERLGVERGQPAPACRGVFAQLEPDREGIAVAIRDGSKRTEGRVLSDAAVAASWIDSWLHDDLDGNAWLLAAPVRVAQAPAHVAPIVPPPRDVEPATPSLFTRVALGAAYEYERTDDDGTASGIGVAGCVQIGGICLGGQLRYVAQPERTVEFTGMGRADTSALVIARWPVRAGRMSIAPEIGIGVGRMSTRRIDGCVPDDNMPPPNCDPGDPNCMTPKPECMDPAGKVYVGDNFEAITWTPRLTAGVRIAVPLSDRIWLDGRASLAAAPFAHTDPFTKTITSPDGTVQPGFEISLPGEPGSGFQIAVGLRVGAQ